MTITTDGIIDNNSKNITVDIDTNNPDIRKQIDAAKAWIEKKYTKKDRICKRSASNSMSDKVYKDSGVLVCNGAFIVAMVELGFECEQKEATQNCFFNVKMLTK